MSAFNRSMTLAFLSALPACAAPHVPVVTPIPPSPSCVLTQVRADRKATSLSKPLFDQCHAACERGDEGACVAVGLFAEAGRHTRRDVERARLHYKAGCEQGYAPACTEWARLIQEPRYAYDSQVGDTLLDACEAGDSVGCEMLFDHLVQGTSARGSKRVLRLGSDLPADVIFSRRCKHGDMKGCALEGFTGIIRKTLAVEDAEALLSRACDGGLVGACLHFGAKRVKRVSDDPQGKAALIRACEGGALPACMLWNDRGAGAAALCQKACDAGDALGCYLVADALDRGRGMPQDRAKARAMLDKQCREGFADACIHLGNARLEAKDDAGATLAYELACTRGAHDTCVTYARRLARGRGAPKDEERAKAIFRATCERGQALGCQSLAAMGEPRPMDRTADTRATEDPATKACMGGELRSCQKLLQRDEPAMSPARVILIAAKMCDLGDAHGCLRLGDVTSTGPDARNDVAVDAYAKGCKLGHKEACEREAEMRKGP